MTPQSSFVASSNAASQPTSWPVTVVCALYTIQPTAGMLPGERTHPSARLGAEVARVGAFFSAEGR